MVGGPSTHVVITWIYTYVKIHRIVTRKEKKSTLLYDTKKIKLKDPFGQKFKLFEMILEHLRSSSCLLHQFCLWSFSWCLTQRSKWTMQSCLLGWGWVWVIRKKKFPRRAPFWVRRPRLCPSLLRRPWKNLHLSEPHLVLCLTDVINSYSSFKTLLTVSLLCVAFFLLPNKQI